MLLPEKMTDRQIQEAVIVLGAQFADRIGYLPILVAQEANRRLGRGDLNGYSILKRIEVAILAANPVD